MRFADIHSHIIAGVDDGAVSEEEMYSLIDEEYRNDVRWLCCTPHYHPGYYGDNKEKSDYTFQKAQEYAQEKYPDLQLYLGNELHYYQGSLNAIQTGHCRTLNGTRFLLVDFDENEKSGVIEFAVMSLLRQGYVPVLAHVERYHCFSKKCDVVERLHRSGAVVQVNASSICGRYHYWTVRRLLRNHIVDVVASDTHNKTKRPPLMKDAYALIVKRYGERYAQELFFINPYGILRGE